ncbi:hypothetical protein IIV22A_125L [Invertebrate iridescent virus 22]|uniref:Uncharacterized protein n=1 Tax=Invertebrate iridescent virus 22 TaxID=345198 RepID=W8W2Q9_9VIRU|nr:hypothetical protein IIV22A_125L [Invertebrate iridescent virus 22]CCV01969.1 hypothetical protein IIV22A_125L [Invertebrate iridescent virus 22]
MDLNTNYEHYIQVPTYENFKELNNLKVGGNKKYGVKGDKKIIFCKYGSIFVGLVTIILLVIFGINNIATHLTETSTNTTETSTNTTETSTNTTETSTNTTETSTNTTETTETSTNTTETTETSTNTTETTETSTNTTETSTNTVSRNLFEMLQSDEKDVVISNKTIIINGGNDSVIIRD